MKIGDKVFVIDRSISIEEKLKGIVEEIKWGLVLIKFEDGRTECTRQKWVTLQ